MAEFPLVALELTRRGRAKRTYVVRTLGIGVITAILFLTWLVSGSSPNSGENFGNLLNSLAFFFQAGVVLVYAPICTAPLIAQEKEERTLGLLLLADMRGHDIVLAKLLSAFLEIELLVLSVLPMLAFAMFFGTVSIGDVIENLTLFTTAAFTACAVGLLCSTFAERPATAFLTTMLSSGTGLIVGNYWRFEIGLGPVCLVEIGIGFAALAITTAILPRQAYERPREARIRRRRRWTILLNRMRPLSPAARILAAGCPGLLDNIRFLPVKILILCGLAALSVFPCLGWVLVSAVICYDIISSLHAARRDGILDDLILTGVSDEELGKAILRSQTRRAMTYLPVYLLPFCFAWLILVIPSLQVREWHDPYDSALVMLFVPLALLAGVALSVAQLTLLAGAGCYSIAAHKTPTSQTVFATLRASVWLLLCGFSPYWVQSWQFVVLNASGVSSSSNPTPFPMQAWGFYATLAISALICEGLGTSYSNLFRKKICNALRNLGLEH
ncbi:MAG: hypothetical protein HY706_05730 [Candidatus Hydrogenedentes bacterium]|nr:hypothetical protein [Candidatus Hydrogenedentota bacterium]